MPAARASTRDDIVAAARRLLVDEGADAVTMRRLAAELGTSYQVVYSRVGGKPEVLRAVHDDAFEELGERVLSGGERPGTAEQIHALTTGYLDFATSQTRLFEVMFGGPVAGLVRDEALREVEVASFRRCWVSAARSWLDVHHPARPPGSAAPLAWRLWTATHGIAVLHIAGHSSPRGDVHADLGAVVDLLLADPLAS